MLNKLFVLVVHLFIIVQSQAQANDTLHVKFIDNRLLVDVKVGDSIDAKLMIDTGIKGLRLDTAFLPKINMMALGNTGLKSKTPELTYNDYFLTTNVSGQTWVVSDITFSVNGLMFEVGGGIGSLRAYPMFNGTDGIISMASFAKNGHTIEILPVENKIILYNQFTKNYTEVPFIIDVATGAPMVELTITVSDGHTTKTISGKFLIDTGYRGTLLLSKTRWEDLIASNIKRDENEYYYLLGDTNFNGNAKCISSVMISAFGITISNTDVEYIIGTSGFFKNFVGILGMRFLEHFNLAIDYKNRKLYYSKADTDSTYIENKYKFITEKGMRIGYTYRKINNKSNVFVHGLVKNGMAEKLGVKLNDKIVEINNKLVSSLTEDEIINNINDIKSLLIISSNGHLIQL